jgi:hypothetical protein
MGMAEGSGGQRCASKCGFIEEKYQKTHIEFLAPYFDLMPDRMAMVIENKGFKINY